MAVVGSSTSSIVPTDRWPTRPAAAGDRGLVVVVVVVVVIDEAQIGHGLLHERSWHGSSCAQRSAWLRLSVDGQARPGRRPGGRIPTGAVAQGATSVGTAGGRRRPGGHARRTGPGPAAPWWTPRPAATSRSSLMPMERTGRSSRSASDDTRVNPGRAASGGPGGPTAIRPAHVEILVRQGADQSATSPGGHAAPAGQPGHVHLDQHAWPPGDAGRWPGPPPPGSPPATSSPAGPAGPPCSAARPRGSATPGRGRRSASTAAAALATSSSA